jgi:hypothetical protein
LLLVLERLLRLRLMQWIRGPCLRLGLLSFEPREPVWLILLVLHRLLVVLLV